MSVDNTCHMHDQPSGESQEDGDSVCCICNDRPCFEISVGRASHHGWIRSWVSAVATEQRITYILEHGHDQLDPWGPTECPSACLVRGL